MGASWAYLAWHFGPSIQLAMALSLVSLLWILSLIDLETGLLLDVLTLPGILVGLAFSLWLGNLQDSLIGAMAGYGVFWVVAKAFLFFTSREGLGYGDFKLLAMLGAFFGWQALPSIVLMASLTGIVIGSLFLLTSGKHARSPIPFGPFLAAWRGDMAARPRASCGIVCQPGSRMNTARVGLTGGIGSGKSTTAAMFSELGVPLLDLDLEGYRLTGSGQKGLTALVEAFGEQILTPDGELDREHLAEKCFASNEGTRRLNEILHPLIWQEEANWLVGQSSPYAIIEASVLLESGGSGRMDAIVVVLADESVRRRRVLARGSQSSSRFDDILARQCSDAERIQAADIVIRNDSDMDALRRQVEDAHAQLTQRFSPVG